MEILKKHKNDILLILSVLILAGGVWLYTVFTRAPGAEVVVTVEGAEVCRFPLDDNREFIIGEGERQNLLVISDGEAAITNASCPDHVCVKSGSISFDGQTIVCLPNKVVVSIVGGEHSGIDGVSG